MPAASGIPVYVGHWTLTKDYHAKDAVTQDVFTGAMSAEGLREIFAEVLDLTKREVGRSEAES